MVKQSSLDASVDADADADADDADADADAGAAVVTAAGTAAMLISLCYYYQLPISTTLSIWCRDFIK